MTPTGLEPRLSANAIFNCTNRGKQTPCMRTSILRTGRHAQGPTVIFRALQYLTVLLAKTETTVNYGLAGTIDQRCGECNIS